MVRSVVIADPASMLNFLKKNLHPKCLCARRRGEASLGKTYGDLSLPGDVTSIISEFSNLENNEEQ